MDKYEKELERLKTLKTIKPIAKFNGQMYFTSEEHQKYLDSIDPTEKVYRRQKDENGKTIFNGVNRLVIDPSQYFAISYWLEEDKAHFVIDPLAIYAKNMADNGSQFNMQQIKGYVSDVKDGVIQDNYKVEYIRREVFLSEFGGNLYDEAPEQAVAVYTALTQAVDIPSAQKLNFK